MPLDLPFHDGCYCYRSSALAAARAQGLLVRCGGGLPCACIDTPQAAPVLDDDPDGLFKALDSIFDTPSPEIIQQQQQESKRMRSVSSGSCQCPCAAMHARAAAAKARKCCGGFCTCPPGQCHCDTTAVTTEFRCCGDVSERVAQEVGGIGLGDESDWKHNGNVSGEGIVSLGEILNGEGGPPQEARERGEAESAANAIRTGGGCCGGKKGPPPQVTLPVTAENTINGSEGYYCGEKEPRPVPGFPAAQVETPANRNQVGGGGCCGRGKPPSEFAFQPRMVDGDSGLPPFRGGLLGPYANGISNTLPGRSLPVASIPVVSMPVASVRFAVDPQNPGGSGNQNGLYGVAMDGQGFVPGENFERRAASAASSADSFVEQLAMQEMKGYTRGGGSDGVHVEEMEGNEKVVNVAGGTAPVVLVVSQCASCGTVGTPSHKRGGMEVMEERKNGGCEGSREGDVAEKLENSVEKVEKEPVGGKENGVEKEDGKEYSGTTVTEIGNGGSGSGASTSALTVGSTQSGRGRGRRRRATSSTYPDDETRDRKFGCNLCNSTFFFKQNRDRHINEVHLGRRPHKCEVERCEAAFKNRSGLKQHVRTVHEKARPFKCERCDSAFGQRNHLTQHVLVVHDKVKMFTCEVCGMSFSNVGNRTQHIRRRH